MAGPEAVTGVLMPSVDRVGRQFPLTLAAAADCPQGLLPALHLGSAATFEATTVCVRYAPSRNLERTVRSLSLPPSPKRRMRRPQRLPPQRPCWNPARSCPRTSPW